MPYLEILAPVASEASKQMLVTAVTDSIVAAFDVPPATVTVYFLPIDNAHYGHAGRMGAGAEGARVFAKLHAYRRELPARRVVAASVTQAIAACFATPSHNVALYFMDRERDEVAHDGHMACDAT
ncbi:MAG: hypothetical protein JWP29_3667 [Rhodoferax sp.]|nr:hypothetical protein [Rhodoferax sp.]